MVLHVKYPSMERQDLSQSQLGAFKFTPVDEVVRNSPQSHPHPLLLQQYSQSLQNGGFNRYLNSSNTTADPSFFNHQIRPSLDASRLQLGPAAVRAAVESASTSPQKRYSDQRKDSMHANVVSLNSKALIPLTVAQAPPFHSQLYGSSENDSLPSMYTSETNGVPLSENGALSFFSHHNSLLKALEAEQEAHEVTKTQLEQERNARQEAEAETQRLSEHNKGLINSIKLLQSTVKHMVKKDSDPGDSTQTTSGKTKLGSTEVSATAVHDSILYDVMAKYKAPELVHRDMREFASAQSVEPPESRDQDTIPKNGQMQQALQSQNALLPEGSKENLEIKRHFDHEVDVETHGPRVQPEKQEPTDEDSVTSTTNGISPNSSFVQHSTRTIGQSDISNGFMLELPASFLSKYGKKPALDRSNVDDELSHLNVPRKANLTVTSAVEPKEFEKENKPPSRVVLMPDTHLIQWKIDERHADELRGVQVETKSENYFQQHPIRFVPKSSDGNLYRTVMIDFIPFGTPYSELLAQIRGGTLESVQMYGPIGYATDFVTARVIFTDETGATGLYLRGQDPGIKMNGQTVRVWQVLEPTYPKNRELEEAIYIHGHTRILIINAPIDNVDQVLKCKLRTQIEAGLVLDIGRSYDGVPTVEFTSIEESTKALNLFLNDREFGGSDFDFDDDYCSAKYT